MPFYKGHPPYNYWLGKHRSKETREKIRAKLKQLYNSPEKHPQYKGKIKRDGYWYIRIVGHPRGGKQGYVAEHRLIMEKHLGRFLSPKEVIHHRNGIINDNRIDNLELCESPGKHIFNHHPEVWNRFINSHRKLPLSE